MAISRIGLSRTSSIWNTGLRQSTCIGQTQVLSRRTFCSARQQVTGELDNSRPQDHQLIHAGLASCRPPRVAYPSIAQTGLGIRHNSSNSPSQSDRKRVTSSDASQAPTSVSAASKPKSLISRLTASMSLKGSATTGETGHSSVAKLVELAKPESRQLAIAVGLVSSPLLV